MSEGIIATVAKARHRKVAGFFFARIPHNLDLPMKRSLKRGDVVFDKHGVAYLVWGVVEDDGDICCLMFVGSKPLNVPVRRRVHVLHDGCETRYISTRIRRFLDASEVTLDGFAEPDLIRDIAAALRAQAMADNRAVPIRRYAEPISRGRQVRSAVYA